ncbi:VCBS repeat-containing protein, partial [Candidatus Woesearchaeota archaeon]|nr:VCBS repeat-containing protein [Candidatus Woesearchaeota archaeon]
MVKQQAALLCIFLLLGSILSTVSTSAATDVDGGERKIEEAVTIEQTKESTVPNEDAMNLDARKLTRVSRRAFSTSVAPSSTLWARAPLDGPESTKPELDIQQQKYNDLFTGSAVYSHQIKVPRGVHGLEPTITISYSSMARSSTSILGPGWSLSAPSITRDTNSTQQREDDDIFFLHLPEASAKLIEASDGYHTEQESFFRITREENGWMLKKKDGITFYFGYNENAVLNSTLDQYESVWYLSEMQDAYGNSVSYEYVKNPGTDQAAYLSRIIYGLSEIQFVYNHSAQQGFDGFVYGTRLKTTALLDRVDVIQNNTLVRAYDFGYTGIGYKKVLASITEIGSDNETTLPPAMFTYYNETGLVEDTRWPVPEGILFGGNDTGIRFFDANEDGFVDIARMKAEDHATYWMNNKGGWNGSEQAPLPLQQGFADLDDTDYGVRFLDLNADGMLDMWQSVKAQANEVNVVLIKEGNSWSQETMSLPEGVHFVEKAMKCNPSYCTLNQFDEGLQCDMNACTRTCAVPSCASTGSIVTDETSPDPQWDYNDMYEASDKGDYGYASPNKCYIFEYTGSDDEDSIDDSDCYDLYTDYNSGYDEYDIDEAGYELDAYAGIGFKGRNEQNSWLATIPATYDAAFYNGDDISNSNWKYKFYTAVDRDGTPDYDNEGDWDGFNWPLCGVTHSVACAPNYETCLTWGATNCGFGCAGEGTAPFIIMGVYRERYSDIRDALKDYKPSRGTVEGNAYFGHGHYRVMEYEPVTTYVYPTCTSSETWSKDTGVRLVDLNKDGRTDLLQATSDVQKAWLNTEGGWQEADGFNPPMRAAFVDNAGRDKGVRIADVNGDGFPDIISGEQSNRTTWLNNGKEWEEDPHWAIPYSAAFLAKERHTGTTFTDIDADGLLDLVKADEEQKRVWRNTGKGWIEDEAINLPLWLDFKNSTSIIADVNGDGAEDMLTATADRKETSLNRAGAYLLLRSITNQFGGITTLGYSPSTQFIHTGSDDMNDLHFPLWVVTEVTLDNGMSGDHQNQFTFEYSYTNGVYDAASREFRGFGTVIEQRPDDSKVYHHFHQDKYRKGLEYLTSIFDHEEQQLQETKQSWDTEEYDNYAIIKLTGMLNTEYGTENSRTTEMQLDYDGYGNPEQILNLGDNTTEMDNWKKEIGYAYNLDEWIVDKPSHFVWHDNEETVLRETWLSYDDLEYGDQPERGSVTQIKQWNNQGDDYFTLFEYDEGGNPTATTNANGYRTEYLYDGSNRFVHQDENALGHIITFDYDQRYEQITSSADQNSITIRYQYDLFGRETKEALPYDSLDQPTVVTSYHMSGTAPSSVTIEARENSGTDDVFTSTYYYDGFGNLIQTQQEAEDGKVIVMNLFHQWDGKIRKQEHPYFTESHNAYETPSADTYATTFDYDPLGRRTKQQNADGTIKTVRYNGSRIVVTDENNHTKEYITDGYNRIASVIEHNQGEQYLTTYQYNPFNNIVTITDNEENNMIMEYDSLGREIRTDDLDRGVWNYRYDGVGNLLWLRDARGIEKNMTYDAINRAKTEQTSDRTIRYVYDDRKIGPLSSASTPSAKTKYFYDDRYRMTKKIFSFHNGTVLSVDYDYDAMDRIKTEENPQGIVEYYYGSDAHLERIPNIIRNTDYNSAGQLSKREYNNGIETTFEYNPLTLRLAQLHSSVQDILYGYDNVGNIFSIEDNKRGVIKAMGYDDLDRLIYANAVQGSDVLYEYDYNYDYSGNILRVASPERILEYEYDGYEGVPVLHSPARITVSEGETG